MKKIFFTSFFVILIVQIGYCQSLHHTKHKQANTRSFYKVEVDTSSNVSVVTIELPCAGARGRIDPPQIQGPVFFYPPAEYTYRCMLMASWALKGIVIPY